MVIFCWLCVRLVGLFMVLILICKLWRWCVSVGWMCVLVYLMFLLSCLSVLMWLCLVMCWSICMIWCKCWWIFIGCCVLVVGCILICLILIVVVWCVGVFIGVGWKCYGILCCLVWMVCLVCLVEVDFGMCKLSGVLWCVNLFIWVVCVCSRVNFFMCNICVSYCGCWVWFLSVYWYWCGMMNFLCCLFVGWMIVLICVEFVFFCGMWWLLVWWRFNIVSV